MAKKNVFLTTADLREEFGLDAYNLRAGEITRAKIDDPENPIPSFFVGGHELFRISDLDKWAEKEILRQRAKSERE